MRTRKEATARESGCGSPGRESSGGELQGREQLVSRKGGSLSKERRRLRSVGGHGESRVPAETVEGGKNPEDGTDEGLAILVPHGQREASVKEKGHPT
jgi:hypothetical protein